MKLLLFPLIILFFTACNQSQPTQNQATEVNQLAANPVAPAPATAPDMYTGAFHAVEYDHKKDISYVNKITLAIQSMDNGVIKGYSIVAGNSRPFEGTYSEKGHMVLATAREPGDDQYDGVFTFQMNRDSQTISGDWTANNRKLGVTKRAFNLDKRIFTYDPALQIPADRIVDADLYGSGKTSEGDADMFEFLTVDAVKYNASTTLLRKEDVENMHKGDLEMTRNAIYARHGYSFKNRRMRYVFDSRVDWYMPVSTDITQQLTEIELKNIELLKRYEQHAERYYDSFGR